MAAYDYSRVAAKALAAIERFGRDMTLTVPADRAADDGATDDPNADGEPWYPGAPDPAPPPDPPTPVTVRGLQTEAKADEIDGRLIRTDQLRILVAGNVAVPVNGRIDGHAIEHVVAVKPGDTVLLSRVYATR